MQLGHSYRIPALGSTAQSQPSISSPQSEIFWESGTKGTASHPRCSPSTRQVDGNTGQTVFATCTFMQTHFANHQ